MIARTLEDLVVYQLASELRDAVTAVTARGALARDWKLRDQTRDAAASVAANVAEGFGRFRPREFARSLRWANGSLNELRSHLADAASRGYVGGPEVESLRRLTVRTGTALSRLILYLDACEPSPHARTPRSRRRSRGGPANR